MNSIEYELRVKHLVYCMTLKEKVCNDAYKEKICIEAKEKLSVTMIYVKYVEEDLPAFCVYVDGLLMTCYERVAEGVDIAYHSMGL